MMPESPLQSLPQPTAAYRVGFLCFNLSPNSASVLLALDRARAERPFRMKAFPLLGPEPAAPLPFAHRPSRQSGRYLSFSTKPGAIPETQIVMLGLPVIRDLLRESDLIVLIGVQSLPAVLATLGARITGKPVVTLLQAMAPAAERRRSRLIRTLKGLVLHLSTHILAHTPPAIDTLREVYHLPAERISSAFWDGAGHEFRQVLQEQQRRPRAALREELSLPEREPVILFCGSMLFLKGIDVLIEAFARFRQQTGEGRLLIAGPDSQSEGQRAALERQAATLGLSESVWFLGPQGWDALARLYLAADLFVLPSRKDVWPKVLVEAALAGLPLISTDVCGSSGYLVRPGENGFVVPAGDPAALALALLAMREEEVRRRMGVASHRIVQEYLLPDQQAEAIWRALAALAPGQEVSDAR